jgi:hypothetical protein
MLRDAGWVIQNKGDIDLSAARGVAVASSSLPSARSTTSSTSMARRSARLRLKKFGERPSVASSGRPTSTSAASTRAQRSTSCLLAGPVALPLRLDRARNLSSSASSTRLPGCAMSSTSTGRRRCSRTPRRRAAPQAPSAPAANRPGGPTEHPGQGDRRARAIVQRRSRANAGADGHFDQDRKWPG